MLVECIYVSLDIRAHILLPLHISAHMDHLQKAHIKRKAFKIALKL
jgi:hypothetical protein